MSQKREPGPKNSLALLAGLAAGGASLVWSYWTTLADLAERWATDPQYSHGYLVPVFALAVLWLRRDRLAKGRPGPAWWGLLILSAGIAARLVGAWFHYIWLEEVSLLPCLAGAVVVAGGTAAWRWSWPAIAFLIYMIPLPFRVATAMAGPLQRFATLASTLALQTLGLPALAEGNVILLNEIEIGVVEACSGLRMLVIFFALATAVALVSRRPLWEKIVMVASAVPIALLANLIRITATGVLHEKVNSEVANAVFHDLAGWLMMPLALGMLWAEFKLYSILLVQPLPAPAAKPAGPRPRQNPPPRPRAERGGWRRARPPAQASVPPAGGG
jgi:exosortase